MTDSKKITREELILVLLSQWGLRDWALRRSVWEAQQYNQQAMEHWQQESFLKTDWRTETTGLFNFAKTVESADIDQQVQKLVKQKLLTMAPSTTDEKGVFLVGLTENGMQQGKALYQALPEAVRNNLDQIVSRRMREERMDYM